MGLEDLVTIIEHDFTDSNIFSALPCKAGTADIITMSYSFTMIPDKAAAMSNITKLLKPDGLCAMTDFFLHGTFDDYLSPVFRLFRSLESRFHQAWFAMDRVFLLDEEQLDLAKPAMEVIWDCRFRGAIPFLPFFQPYHGVYIMKKL